MRPSIDFRGDATKNIIVGNTVLYGATSGEAFFRAASGERFAVRLSGDDGRRGHRRPRLRVHDRRHRRRARRDRRNFAAGMSGGIAYVYDEGARRHVRRRCNTPMVALEPVPPRSSRDPTRALWHRVGCHADRPTRRS